MCCLYLLSYYNEAIRLNFVSLCLLQICTKLYLIHIINFSHFRISGLFSTVSPCFQYLFPIFFWLFPHFQDWYPGTAVLFFWDSHISKTLTFFEDFYDQLKKNEVFSEISRSKFFILKFPDFSIYSGCVWTWILMLPRQQMLEETFSTKSWGFQVHVVLLPWHTLYLQCNCFTCLLLLTGTSVDLFWV